MRRVVYRHCPLLAFHPMPSKTSLPPGAAALAELAEAEAVALKERRKAREAALRRYGSAEGSILQAQQTMSSGRAEQAKAIGELLATGLDVGAVAKLLGIDPRRVREARATKAETTPAPQPAPEAN